MGKKYKLGKKKSNGLYRIIALRDIPKLGVRKGDVGGFVQSEENLSQSGDAWLFEDACVCDNGLVRDNAVVSGNARVYGNAKVYDVARIRGNTRVHGEARVYGNAEVFGDAEVCDAAQVFYYGRVFGNSLVSGDAKIKTCFDIANFIIPKSYSITVTPQNIAIGCQVKTRNEWLKITKKQAVKMGLKPELYEHYKSLIKTGMKLVKKAK